MAFTGNIMKWRQRSFWGVKLCNLVLLEIYISRIRKWDFHSLFFFFTATQCQVISFLWIILCCLWCIHIYINSQWDKHKEFTGGWIYCCYSFSNSISFFCWVSGLKQINISFYWIKRPFDEIPPTGLKKFTISNMQIITKTYYLRVIMNNSCGHREGAFLKFLQLSQESEHSS